jgi:uncharacterized protein (TIGR02147 family)
MSIYQYLDYRQFIRDRVSALQSENDNLSIREILRRVECTSPSYYKEVIVDGKKRMSLVVARRFAHFLTLTTPETDYFILLVQFNQAKTELERLHFYEKLIHFKQKPQNENHFLTIREYGYMANWQNLVIRELLPLLSAFGNRSAAERAELAAKLRIPITDKQIDSAIALLESLRFIRKDDSGNYRKTDTTIRAETRSPAAYKMLCQFTDLGKEVINTSEVQDRLFKVAILSMNKENRAIVDKKLDSVCQEIVEIAGADDESADRLYGMNILFYPLTKLPEER